MPFTIPDMGGVFEYLESEGVTPDRTYDICDLVGVLKEIVSTEITYPEGYTAGDIGVSRPDDSEGYRVMVRPRPDAEFWLTSKLFFPGNANGITYADMLIEIGRVADTASWLLAQWPS